MAENRFSLWSIEIADARNRMEVSFRSEQGTWIFVNNIALEGMEDFDDAVLAAQSKKIALEALRAAIGALESDQPPLRDTFYASFGGRAGSPPPQTGGTRPDEADPAAGAP